MLRPGSPATPSSRREALAGGYRVAEGNPLFLEQCSRWSVRKGSRRASSRFRRRSRRCSEPASTAWTPTSGSPGSRGGHRAGILARRRDACCRRAQTSWADQPQGLVRRELSGPRGRLPRGVGVPFSPRAGPRGGVQRGAQAGPEPPARTVRRTSRLRRRSVRRSGSRRPPPRAGVPVPGRVGPLDEAPGLRARAAERLAEAGRPATPAATSPRPSSCWARGREPTAQETRAASINPRRARRGAARQGEYGRGDRCSGRGGGGRVRGRGITPRGGRADRRLRMRLSDGSRACQDRRAARGGDHAMRSSSRRATSEGSAKAWELMAWPSVVRLPRGPGGVRAPRGDRARASRRRQPDRGTGDHLLARRRWFGPRPSPRPTVRCRRRSSSSSASRR